MIDVELDSSLLPPNDKIESHARTSRSRAKPVVSAGGDIGKELRPPLALLKKPAQNSSRLKCRSAHSFFFAPITFAWLLGRARTVKTGANGDVPTRASRCLPGRKAREQSMCPA
jgi:hypothetical protein